MSLAPIGPAQALFKTANRFVLQLELFRENKRDIRWDGAIFLQQVVNGMSLGGMYALIAIGYTMV